MQLAQGEGIFEDKKLVKFASPLVCLLCIYSGTVVGQVDSGKSPKVVINGSVSDTELRQESVAGKIIISRKNIEDSGVTTAYELLKRQPAVTVSAKGQLGLMGMPGYTQLLIDGVPAPAGKNPLDLDVVHIEKVEIVRSAMAEFGPFGSAGTINIVSRKINRRNLSMLRTGVTASALDKGANLAWSTNIADDVSPFSYAAQVSVSKSRKHVEEQSRLSEANAQADAAIIQRSDLWRQNDSQTLLGAGTIAWQYDKSNTLSLDPSWMGMQFDTSSRDSSIWSPLGRGPMFSAQTVESPFHSFSLPLKWETVPSAGSKFSLSLSPTRFSYRKELERDELFADLTTRVRQNQQHSDRKADFIKANYSTRAEAHTVKAGVTVSRNTEDARFGYLLNGADDISLGAFGLTKQAVDNKLSLFLQDEWRVDSSLSVNLGVASERRSMQLHEGVFDSRIRYAVTSPSANLTWRESADSKNQVRLGIAKTYTEPFADQLSARPDINPLSPCPATGQCGANAPEFADTVGNPQLRPERAIGVNLSLERYLTADSLITLELFARQFRDTVGKHLELMNVVWADQPRYVLRPENLGTAWSRGIGIELQLLTSDISPSLPKIELRGAVNYAVSRISLVPGPDNRIAGQSPWTAKLGGEYKLSSLPLKIGADLNLLPSGWIRSSDINRSYSNHRFDLGASGTWTFNPKLKLIANIDHLASNRNYSEEEFGSLAAAYSSRSTIRKIEPTLGVKLDQRF
jgi:outer membrane receptor for ferrienterochelin and colicin